MADASLGYNINYLIEENMLFHPYWDICRKRGAYTDMIIDTDSYFGTMELFY